MNMKPFDRRKEHPMEGWGIGGVKRMSHLNACQRLKKECYGNLDDDEREAMYNDMYHGSVKNIERMRKRDERI
jgi:hypothetical protein